MNIRPPDGAVEALVEVLVGIDKTWKCWRCWRCRVVFVKQTMHLLEYDSGGQYCDSEVSRQRSGPHTKYQFVFLVFFGRWLCFEHFSEFFTLVFVSPRRQEVDRHFESWFEVDRMLISNILSRKDCNLSWIRILD